MIEDGVPDDVITDELDKADDAVIEETGSNDVVIMEELGKTDMTDEVGSIEVVEVNVVSTARKLKIEMFLGLLTDLPTSFLDSLLQNQ